MPKQLSEAAAWREVGRGIEERGGLAVKGAGLCLEMARLRYAGLAPGDKSYDYDNPRIHLHLGRALYAYDSEEWEARCLAAYWMALEAEEEARPTKR